MKKYLVIAFLVVAALLIAYLTFIIAAIKIIMGCFTGSGGHRTFGCLDTVEN